MTEVPQTKSDTNHVNQWKLFSSEKIFPLFAVQFFGAANDNIFKLAVTILITYQLAEAMQLNAAIIINLAALMLIIPYFLFSGTAGRIGDQVEKSSATLKLKLLEGICVISACFAFYLVNVELMLFTIFLFGVQSAFFSPIKYAILPQYLKKHELISGNGLIEMGTFVAILVGNLIGTSLILLDYGKIIILAIMFLAAFLGIIAALRMPEAPALNEREPFKPLDLLTDWYEQVSIFSQKPRDLLMISLALNWFWFYGGVLLQQMPIYTKDWLGGNETVMTWFLILFSVGIAGGSLLAHRLTKGEIHLRYCPWALAIMSFCLMDLYWMAPSAMMSDLRGFSDMIFEWPLIRVSLDIVISSMAAAIYSVPLYALLQTKSDPTMRSRVVGANNVVWALFLIGASIYAIALLKAGLSIPMLLLVTGLINLLSIIPMVVLARKFN